MAYTAKPSKIPSWATSTGSNILTGLTATAAQWQSNITISGAQYGIIRYTFSGSPNLSTVLAGHKLNVTTGFTNTENKVSGAEIYAVNDASDYVDVLSLERLSNSLDETGVSATSTTITDNGARIVEPSTSKKAQGWRSPEKPSDGFLNWLLYYIGAWIAMLDANYPTGYLLQGRLTAGPGVALSDNGDNTYLITGDGVISTGTITQASHGFSATNAIYHNGTTWAKAKGNALATCRSVWIVTSATTNTFIAVRAGRVTVASHGLTPGSLYYLSAATAGALTATRPVGSTSAPLGYFTPLVYAESTSVLHIVGGNPQFNPVYAEYIASGNVALNTLAFSNISLNNVGNTLRFELTGEEDDTSVATARIKFSAIAAGNYSYVDWNDEGGTWTRVSATSQNYFNIGDTDGGSTGDNMTCHGKIMRVNANEWHSYSEYSQKPAGGSSPEMGIIRGRTLTTATNLTNIDFGSSSSNFRLISGDFIRLIIDRMPDA